MADGIQIRITGDDSEFLKTLSSLESSALATLEGLTAAASAAGGAFGEAMARYGEAMGGADGPWDAEALIARAREMAGAVAQAWSDAAVLEAPMLTAARGALDPGALLTDALEGLQADFSGAAETLRAALMEGYLRPGFEGVDWEAMAQHLSARLTQAGQGGAAALAAGFFGAGGRMFGGMHPLGLCAVVLATDGAVRTWLIVVAALAAVAIGIYIERTLRGHKYHPPVDPNLDGVEESHGLHHHKEKHNDEA